MTSQAAVQCPAPRTAFTDALEPALLGRFQIPFQRRRSAQLIDVIIRSNGQPAFVFRTWHDMLNVKIASVLAQLAYELNVPSSVAGEHDFRGFLSSHLSSPAYGYAQRYEHKGTQLWIEPDGLLVIVDSRFKRFRNDMSHAGRNRYVAYASSLKKAYHEMTELRALARWALDIRLLSPMHITHGQLGNRMLDLLNRHLPAFSHVSLNQVLVHLQACHDQGLRAESDLILTPPIAQLVDLGGVELSFSSGIHRHHLREDLDHIIHATGDSANIMAAQMLREVADDFHAGFIEEARALLEETARFAATHFLGRTQRAALSGFQTLFKNWETPFHDLSSAASFRAMLSGLGGPDQLLAVFSDNGYRIVVLAQGAQSFLAVVEERSEGLFRPAARALMTLNAGREATGDMLFAFLRGRGLIRRAIRALLLQGFIDDPRFIVLKDNRRYRVRLRAPVPLVVSQQA